MLGLMRELSPAHGCQMLLVRAGQRGSPARRRNGHGRLCDGRSAPGEPLHGSAELLLHGNTHSARAGAIVPHSPGLGISGGGSEVLSEGWW